jgi:hypothetical protein
MFQVEFTSSVLQVCNNFGRLQNLVRGLFTSEIYFPFPKTKLWPGGDASIRSLAGWVPGHRRFSPAKQ